MNMVCQKTRELGEALLASEEYRNMKRLEDQAMKNAEAAYTMGQYLERKGQIEKLLTEESPDAQTLRQLSDEMDSLQERLGMIDDIQKLTEARAAFSGLIDQVNSALKFIITGKVDNEETEEAHECAGSCHSCSGCGHRHMN